MLASWVIILFLLILVAIFVAICRSRHGLQYVLGFMLLMGTVSLVFLFLAFAPWRAVDGVGVDATRVEQSSHLEVERESVVTNQQLWDRITESRIDLSEEPESDPPAESKSDARPAWVDKPPKRVGDVHRAVVTSDPFSTVDECFEQLELRFPKEVQKRLSKWVPSDQRSLVGSESLEATGITLDYIMQKICQEHFTEIVESSVGPMKQVHVLMEFTPAIKSHLLDSWQKHLRRYRLTSVAQIAGCVLAALAILYGMLQFDTWTRGYYTQRLLWGVPAAIIAVAFVYLFVS